jgi:hypothetical protein
VSSASESTRAWLGLCRGVPAAVGIVGLLGVVVHLRGRRAVELGRSLRIAAVRDLLLTRGELIALADDLVRLIIEARVLSVEPVRAEQHLVSALVVIRRITAVGMLLGIVLPCGEV